MQRARASVESKVPKLQVQLESRMSGRTVEESSVSEKDRGAEVIVKETRGVPGGSENARTGY